MSEEIGEQEQNHVLLKPQPECCTVLEPFLSVLVFEAFSILKLIWLLWAKSYSRCKSVLLENVCIVYIPLYRILV